MREERLTVLIGGPGFMVEEYVRIVRDRFPKLKILPYPVLTETDQSQVPEGVEEVDIIASFNPYPRAMARIKALKWFQVLMTGYEHVLRTGLVPPEVPLTTTAGTVSIPIAEVVMGYLLFFVKKFKASLENQSLRRMDRMLGQMRELHDRTIGILGLGNIGKVIAKKAKLGFEMRVLGYDKVVKEWEYADRIYPVGGLDEVLKAADFLVISLSLTEETRGLIGERELGLMKPTAYLVNVARGEILDKEAFTKALREHWIAGAAIDVFWGDPTAYELAEDDELWGLDNLFITAHNATGTDRYVMRTADLFCDNLERFMNGRDLINLVGER
ncbi:MAG: D-2-hydroxyacid dehydrogenase [Deltaproteobacteria bacterium]|nr:D-2-hydroxyacid dehydrogenase [Deltaproteobacteria bacterium]